MHTALGLVTGLALGLTAIVGSDVADAQSTDQTSAQVTVSVSNIRASTGAIEIGIFESEADWQDDTPIRFVRLDLAEGVRAATFDGLEPGNYAASAYHDVDGNGEFDMGFAGIPREPYGFSNNPRPRFRGARFDEAEFELVPQEHVELTIDLMGG